MGSSSFLGLYSIEEEGKCLICNKAFRIKDKIHCFGVDSWPKFTEQAEERSELKTHKDNNEYVYKSVHSKLNGTEEPFWKPEVVKEFGLRHLNSVAKFGDNISY